MAGTFTTIYCCEGSLPVPLSPEIAPHIALVLLDLVGESVTELLPVLQNIFLEDLQPSGLVLEGIEQFVAARQLVSHPVSVSRWAEEY